MFFLSGGKINLRDFRLDDLDSYAYWLTYGHKWQELDSPFLPAMEDEDIERVIDKLRLQIKHHNFPPLRKKIVIADLETDELIGMVSRYWISIETYWTAIGISIYDPAHWGKGYGYEALGLWSDYLLRTETTFARLDIRTWSGNLGMQRLAEKLGYQLEARFRDARIWQDEYYDDLGYGILRHEWETRYPDGFKASLKETDQIT